MKRALSRSAHPKPDRLAEIAVDAAQSAGRVLKKYFGAKLRIREKAGAGLVTQADLEAEAAATRLLKKATPDFDFLTEESEPVMTGAPGRWILDPLDGTTNFVHRFPMFCVSIAAEWEGRLVAGAIYHPILDETYIAIRGKGAWVNGRRLRVSKTADLSASLLTTGFTYRKDEWLRAEMEAFENLSRVARAVRRPGSAALDLAYTARGVFDGFWERRLSPWDVAAGALLVAEAGGKVSGFDGQDLDLLSGQIVASNGKLHGALLRAVQTGPGAVGNSDPTL